MGRYLITGAAGFIGRELSSYLKSLGHDVWVLLRRPAEGSWDRCFYCELGYEKLPIELMDGVDGVFHLANIAHTTLSSDGTYWKVNLEGTIALLNAAVKAGVRGFVYFSSVKASGDPGSDCIDELSNLEPVDSYGKSKRAAEISVLNAGVESGIHVCILRPALVYGPGVKGNLYQMLRLVYLHRFPPLPDLDNKRSMIYRNDLVIAAWMVMTSQKARGQIYIITDGVEYSTRSLYKAMCLTFGISLPRWFVPISLLKLGATVGDLFNRLTGVPVPFNTEIYSRLTGSACYTSLKIRQELSWKSEKNFFEVVPEMASHLISSVSRQEDNDVNRG